LRPFNAHPKVLTATVLLGLRKTASLNPVDAEGPSDSKWDDDAVIEPIAFLLKGKLAAYIDKTTIYG
jgi:hypothetical protein